MTTITFTNKEAAAVVAACESIRGFLTPNSMIESHTANAAKKVREADWSSDEPPENQLQSYELDYATERERNAREDNFSPEDRK